MKKRIFAAVMALCLMAGTSVMAQDAKKAPMPKEKWTPEQMAQKKTDQMTQSLKLNEQQAKQVYDYNLMQIKDMQAKHEQYKADRKAEMEKMKTILTPEQMEMWKKMQSEKMSNHKEAWKSKDGKDCNGGDCKDGKMKGNMPESKKEK